MRGIFFIRQQQHKSILIRYDIEPLYIAGIGQHVAVIIIVITVHFINIYEGSSAVTEQLFLILHPLSSKQFHGIIQGIRFLQKRCLCLHQLPHPVTDLCSIFFCRIDLPFGRDVGAVPDSKLYTTILYRFSSEHIKYCFQKKHGGRADVGLIPHVVFQCKKSDLTISRQLFEQFSDLAVSCCQCDQIVILLLVIIGYIFVGSPLGILSLFTVYLHCDHFSHPVLL